MIGMDRDTGRALEGVDHLHQSIADILGTPIGSRVIRRSYGSDLPELLDQPMNGLGRLRIFAATALALMRQERRVRLSRVALERTATPGRFALRLQGRRVDTPTRTTALDLVIPVRAISALA